MPSDSFCLPTFPIDTGPQKSPIPALMPRLQVRISPTVPNFITVNWYFDPNNALQSQLYTVGIFLVKRLSPKDLIDKLSKDGVKPPEFAKVGIHSSYFTMLCYFSNFCFLKTSLFNECCKM